VALHLQVKAILIACESQRQLYDAVIDSMHHPLNVAHGEPRDAGCLKDDLNSLMP